MKKRFLIVLLSLLAGASPNLIPAQTPPTPPPTPSATPVVCSTCAVFASGYVYDKQNSLPIEGATVGIEWVDFCWGYQYQDSTFSDQSGYYSFLPYGFTHITGQGTLTAEKSGYHDSTYEFSTSGHQQHDFDLEPLSTPPPTPTPSTTPICLPCAPWLEPTKITLGDQADWGTVTYHCDWCCHSFYSCSWSVGSHSDWLVVDPLSGSGYDGQSYPVVVSPGDVSALPWGRNEGIVIFGCESCSPWWFDELEVVYFKNPAPAVISRCDYDGDGASDIALFRLDSKLWAVRGITRVYFGPGCEVPLPGDYDGDGAAEMSCVLSSPSCTHLSGDYDGDGCDDAGIFNRTSGLWVLPDITRLYFGGPGDRPVGGDYDGDGTDEIGIFRGDSGLWALLGVSRIYFGSAGDEIVPGDYDGRGVWKPAVFRSGSGLWALRGVTRCYFGSRGDQAVPADYDGDSTDDIGIFRDEAGLWAAGKITRTYFGAEGDIPLTR